MFQLKFNSAWLTGILCLTAVTGIWFSCFQSGWLYSLISGQYLSPDEIAYQQFSLRGPSLDLPSSAEYQTLTQWYSPVRTTVIKDLRQVPVGFATWPELLFQWSKFLAPNFLAWVLFLFLGLSLWFYLKALGPKSKKHFWFLYLLWFTSPAIIYYFSRPLFPNLSVMLLFVLGAINWLRFSLNPRHFSPIAITVFSWSLALALRPVEIIWILPGALAWMYFNPIPGNLLTWIRAYNFRSLILFLLCLTPFAWLLTTQIKITGTIFPLYLPVTAVDAARQPIWYDWFIPFGWHPKHQLLSIYLWLRHTWPWVLSLFGILLWSINDLKIDWHLDRWKNFRPIVSALIILASVFVPIIFYYGNYLAFDNPQGLLGATSSFTRYALPLNGILWLIWLRSRLTEKISVSNLTSILILLLTLTFISIRQISPTSWNLTSQIQVLSSQAQKFQAINQLLANEIQPIIFTRIADKWLWPKFAILQPPLELVSFTSATELNSIWSQVKNKISSSSPKSFWWYTFCLAPDKIDNQLVILRFQSSDQKECLYQIN